MTIPASASTGTVTGTWVDSDGEPCTGTVTFTPSTFTLRVAADDTTLIVHRTVATLDDAGSISQELIATDDTDTDPTGFTWTARVALADTVTYTIGPFAVLGGQTADLTAT